MTDKAAKETSPVRDELGQFADTYSSEMADRICAEIADGKSVRSICKMADMPGKRTVFEWLGKYPEFKTKYDIATMERAEAYAEEIVDIADDGSNDWMRDNDPENEGYRLNGEHVQRSKLRLEARKWICAKMKPRKFGDKVAVGGAEDLPPIGTADITEGEYARRIAFALANGLKPTQEKPE